MTNLLSLRTVVCGVLAASGVALAACGDEDKRSAASAASPAAVNIRQGPPRSTADLVGIWFKQDKLLVRFGRSGKFAIDCCGNLDDNPAGAGRITLKGAAATFSADRGSDVCRPGDRWAWRTTLSNVGRLHVTHTASAEGACGVNVGTQWTFTRVSPISPAGAGLTANLDPETPVRPASLGELTGFWLLEGGARLLRVGGDGTYATDDTGDGPKHVGTIEMSRDGRLTFTAGKESRTCRPGTRTIWNDVDIAPVRIPSGHPLGGPGNSSVLRGTVAQDACSGTAGRQQTWVRLVPL